MADTGGRLALWYHVYGSLWTAKIIHANNLINYTGGGLALWYHVYGSLWITIIYKQIILLLHGRLVWRPVNRQLVTVSMVLALNTLLTVSEFDTAQICTFFHAFWRSFRSPPQLATASIASTGTNGCPSSWAAPWRGSPYLRWACTGSSATLKSRKSSTTPCSKPPCDNRTTAVKWVSFFCLSLFFVFVFFPLFCDGMLLKHNFVSIL